MAATVLKLPTKKKPGGALTLSRALTGWGRAKFAENLSATPFNESTFSQILKSQHRTTRLKKTLTYFINVSWNFVKKSK
jgi:hypothetical protein